MNALKSLTQYIFSPEVWPKISLVMWALFFFIVLRILWLMLWHREEKKPKTKKPSPFHKQYRFVLGGVVFLFASVLIYQATWQLFGHTRTQFVEFMMRYDRRQFNPAHQIERGRILDRNGVVLAMSEERGGQMIREYPLGPVFAHVVGYSHPQFGMAGLESVAQAQLIGSSLESLKDWRALGKTLFQQAREFQGEDLALTLDARLQSIAWQSLRAGNYRGAVVAIDILDGSLLALATSPSFDPNQLTRELFAADPDAAPLLNRAVSGLYPPGSTFKVAVSAIALEAGFRGTIDCPPEGFTTSPELSPIRDHEYYDYQASGRVWPGYGEIDMQTALRHSSNVFYAKLGANFGSDTFEAMAQRFFFNQPITIFDTGGRKLELTPGELPVPGDGDLYALAQMSIGQGKLLATPTHMAMIAATVANRGVMVKPRLVIADPPQTMAQSIPEEVALEVGRMMRDVVVNGTGRDINTPGLSVAGKTGTAENSSGASHSWFIGFAPFENPRIAFSVLVENGGFGSKTALPIAKRLVIEARDLGYLDPLPAEPATPR